MTAPVRGSGCGKPVLTWAGGTDPSRRAMAYWWVTNRRRRLHQVPIPDRATTSHPVIPTSVGMPYATMERPALLVWVRIRFHTRRPIDGFKDTASDRKGNHRLGNPLDLGFRPHKTAQVAHHSKPTMWFSSHRIPHHPSLYLRLISQHADRGLQARRFAGCLHSGCPPTVATSRSRRTRFRRAFASHGCLVRSVKTPGSRRATHRRTTGPTASSIAHVHPPEYGQLAPGVATIGSAYASRLGAPFASHWAVGAGHQFGSHY
jgi:hypothetical protein